MPKADIEVRTVAGRREMNDFVKVPERIYSGSPYYVPEMAFEVRSLFDPKRNSALTFSELRGFVAYKDDEAVGRIVGIVNRKANERWQKRAVRFSMIEFIDDEAVSRALIDAVALWGRKQGMEMIEGPLGITDFDKEGMLVEDFDLIGSVNTLYNPEYYPRHMEALGLEKEVDWLQVHIKVPHEVPAKYARVAQYCREQMGLRVVKLTKRQIRGEYGYRAFELFNEAYKPIFGFSALSKEQMDEFISKYLIAVDSQLIPVILDAKGDVIGVAISMGSLSRPMQRAKGRLLPLGWWHLLRALTWHKEDNAEMLLVAIRPDYQGMGVNAMFFDDLVPIFNKYGFTWAETGPQLEDNIRELTQWRPLSPKYVKRRRCYQKRIDEK